MVTTLLDPGNVALFHGIEPDAVNLAFSNFENVFVGILCGLIGAWSYDRFTDTELPDALAFFAGRRSFAIDSAGLSLVLALALLFIWPLVFSGLVAFGEFILPLGPVGMGVLFSNAVAAFFVGVTEPREFAVMFLAPGWVNPRAQNPWAIPLMGIFWFAVHFLAVRAIILKFDLKTPGRDDSFDGRVEGEDASSDSRYVATAIAFLAALGGAENITDLENCATAHADGARRRLEGRRGGAEARGRRRDDEARQALRRGDLRGLRPVREGRDGADHERHGPARRRRGCPRPRGAGRRRGGRRERHRAAGLLPRAPEPARRRHLGAARPGAGPDLRPGGMGPGIAIEPSDGLVLAPAEGTVAHVFPTGHAVALTREDDVEVLIHVGLDTVEMRGHGFETLVRTGDRVVAGMPLLRADLPAIRGAGHPTVTPVIVMNDPGARVELV